MESTSYGDRERLALAALEPFALYNDAREAATHRPADHIPLLIAAPTKGPVATVLRAVTAVTRAPTGLACLRMGEW